ncbi:hypothetical protein [Altererythrobacter lutimaris]|uniref:Lipoprotein n=1 Tax=Altererythrobacter lutimaris TaxID=2743979 RepID=A0A850HBX5_9SPHN|nr:hypothetical protein [Altererythrobacter lutimaris]NVE94426.1 hypothetical protein [Altererythrobacter lutimaris]
MLARFLFVLAAPLLLTGCLISPGKFASTLDLNDDGTFAFTYEGEIFFMGLSQLAQMGNAAEEFEAEECYNEETFEDRECTEEELAQQRAEWDSGAEQRAAEAKKEAEDMAAMMGGIDPSDPEAAEELRQLLLRHRGWNRVESKGNGVYDVSYSVTGQLGHDFMFPTIEGFPPTNPFVQIVLRDENTVRVNAPGFAAEDGSNPMGAMMGGMTGLAGLAALGDEDAAKEMGEIPSLEGTFTIRTTGEILANNTDEGASRDGNARVLSWDVDAATPSAPTALVRFD